MKKMNKILQDSLNCVAGLGNTDVLEELYDLRANLVDFLDTTEIVLGELEEKEITSPAIKKLSVLEADLRNGDDV